ncbi:hypothetical protein ACJ7VZ_18625 [Aeromonas salmonicida]|uniref:hypothetical protein n=1 Tax=Aeromonas salmonicida TaxID=645 RepID=UPI0031FBCC38
MEEDIIEVIKLVAQYDTALIAAFVAFITSITTSFVGPWLLERRRALIEENAYWGPSKDILREMLDNAAPNQGRSIGTLKKVTGLPDKQLCRLLISIGARGFSREDGSEAWIYKKQRPFEKQ